VLFALQGIKQFFSRDRNGKIQMVIGILRSYWDLLFLFHLFNGYSYCFVLD
jgi:hypothetical protein